MRYRQLDENFDYTISKFLVDSPECVGQAVKTRLLLWMGEWFMDTNDGTPYLQDIVGVDTNYDLEIKARILETPGVNEIIEYSSSVNELRQLSVNTTLDTIYGQTTVTI